MKYLNSGLTASICLVLFACSAAADMAWSWSDSSYLRKREYIVNKYKGLKPVIFSMWTQGVVTRIDTTEKVIALTLDACGGKRGSGYDRELVEFLRNSNVPATLFLCGLWIDANPELTKKLAADPLFEIENHGLRHRPASVKGAVVFGKRGTADPGKAFDEIVLNSKKIFSLTGIMTKYFRPGTAYFDDVAVLICYEAGHLPVNFSIISGDASGFSAERIKRRIIKGAKNGAIIIGHINHPGSGLFPALKKAVPELRGKGYRFVKLEEFHGSLKALK